jgi:hypothetical protein
VSPFLPPDDLLLARGQGVASRGSAWTDDEIEARLDEILAS